MDVLQNRYVLFPQKIELFLGVSPAQTYKQRILRYFILSFVLFSSVILHLCQLFSLDYNLRSIVFVLPILILDVSFAFQYVTTFLHYVNVKILANMVERDWKQLKDDSELKIMQKFAHQTVVWTRVFGFVCVLFGAWIIVPPVLRKILSTNGAISSTDHFPVFSCLDYFIDPETFYYPILIYQIIIFTITLLTALGCYSLFFWSIQHTCARLSIIKNEINRPFINNTRNKKPKDLSRWMIGIIQHLAQITEFVKLLNTVSEKNYLVQVTLLFFLIINNFLCIPALLEHEDDKKEVFIVILFIIFSLVLTYVTCYIGQRLINYSEEVYNETCLISIPEISLETQKLLLTTLMINAKPCSLTIGKIFVSSHQFFADLIRTSLSFAMVLHSTQNL